MFVYEHLNLCVHVAVFTDILDQSTKGPHNQAVFVLTPISDIDTEDDHLAFIHMGYEILHDSSISYYSGHNSYRSFLNSSGFCNLQINYN